VTLFHFKNDKKKKNERKSGKQSLAMAFFYTTLFQISRGQHASATLSFTFPYTVLLYAAKEFITKRLKNTSAVSEAGRRGRPP